MIFLQKTVETLSFLLKKHKQQTHLILFFHLTIDQLKLLKYNNVKSENGITNFDIGCPSKIDFEEGVQKYSYNWTEGGQYSRNSGQ